VRIEQIALETRFKSPERDLKPSAKDMVDLEITYCQPCGHQPRAVELVNQLLAEYGMPLNKKLTVALKPADSGIFDVVLDGQLIFSRKQEGRFPTVDEIKKQIEPKLSIPLEVPSK
jgi:selenoprotein W-related protein